MPQPKMTPLNYKDFCIKACVENPEDIDKILKEMNAHFVGTDCQLDTYFKVSEGKLKWRLGMIENLITHYSRINEGDIEKTVVFRYDLHPTKEEIAQLFRDYDPLGVVEKERRIYFHGNIKIHLDKMANQTYFLEIEVLDRENILSDQILFNQAMDMKNTLHIPDKALIKTGYFNSEH
jgi:adenylate cyclase class 2